MKWFRKIRQNLLAQGRFTRYLTYAIGEIILVVIGILIALQINNWNNDRTTRAREIKYLHGLKADFAVDLHNLNQFIHDKVRKTSSAFLLLNCSIPETVAEMHRLDSLSWNVYSWNTFVSSTKTLDELIGSGNLSFITNDSIKFRMLGVIQEYQNLALHTAHMRREYDMYLYDRTIFQKEQFTFTNWESILASKKMTYTVEADETRLALLKQQWVTLLQDISYRNGLKLAILNNQVMHSNCSKMVREINEIMELIEQEIQDSK